MMQFIFDNTNTVDSATNWEEVSSTLKVDDQYNLFLLHQEYTLNFIGSGYQKVFVLRSLSLFKLIVEVIGKPYLTVSSLSVIAK